MASASLLPSIHYQHEPVLLAETLKLLAPRLGGKYLDATLGLGGHARAILASSPDSELCGLDQDAQALALAEEKLAPFGSRAHLFQSRYSRFAEALKFLGWEKIDGTLLDLGVSSLQLDDPQRGFSFNADAPLDMRMDQNSGQRSAWHWVNMESFATLKDCLASYGEEPQAGRIARAIVEARQRSPIETTLELAAIVSRAYPPAWRKTARRHPATRTFQALRMAVNNELEELKIFLSRILSWLKIGGKLVIITFHSLEDRIVKQKFRQWAEACRCPRHFTRCECGHRPEVRIICKKPVQASALELERNPRASSAKLRAVEKIAEPEQDAGIRL